MKTICDVNEPFKIFDEIKTILTLNLIILFGYNFLLSE